MRGLSQNLQHLLSLRYLFSVLFALIINIALFAQSHGQLLPSGGAAQETTEVVQDGFNRGTPRSSVEHYLKAIAEGNYQRAARYLDLDNLDDSEKPSEGKLRARQLKDMLDRDGYFFETTRLSNSPDGFADDDQDQGVDVVGLLDQFDRKVPILIKRSTGQSGAVIWRIDSKVHNRLGFLLRVTHESRLNQILPDTLQETVIANVPIGHWLAIFVAAFLALTIGILLGRVITGLLRKPLAKRTHIPGHAVVGSITIPLGVFIGVSLYRYMVVYLGVDVIARDTINWIAIILSLLSLGWLGVRIVDGVSDIVRFGMSRTNRLNSVSVIMLARRIGKTVVMGVIAIAVLDTVGVDVTTGLAALGIGGLALALGAQKTIENLVGSITVVADKPVRVGDFCQFGDTSGTVEEIGIRSTRIRTLSRTIVTIPNGAFASMQIENYTLRDQFKLQTTLNMRYETTPDQVRFLLVKIRELLYSHIDIDNEPARVRLTGLGAHSIDIGIFTYIRATTYENFMEIQEDILLRIMDIVKESGTDFAFPSQTIYFAKDQLPEASIGEKAESEVEKMREEQDLPLPRFAPEKIEELNGQIKLGDA